MLAAALKDIVVTDQFEVRGAFRRVLHGMGSRLTLTAVDLAAADRLIMSCPVHKFPYGQYVPHTPVNGRSYTTWFPE